MADEAELLLSDALEEAIDGITPEDAANAARLHPAPAAPPLPEGLPHAAGQTTADLPHDGAVLEVGEEEAIAPPRTAPSPSLVPPQQHHQQQPPAPTNDYQQRPMSAGAPAGQSHHQATDSITLGQLKGHVMNMPKPKPWMYSYEHKDCGSTRDELEEFFSYTEIPGLISEGQEAWERGWNGQSRVEWPQASKHEQKDHLYALLEQLEARESPKRFEAARRLFYVAQGTPMYSTSPEQHLELILKNCTLLRSVGTVQVVYDALRTAGGRWVIVSNSLSTDDSLPQPTPSEDWPSLEERQEFLEEINAEMSLYLGILYFMAENFKKDADWAEDLMTLAPPLPVYLFGLVAGLKEKNAKGYPVKKLLLLLWKVLLACFGGQREIARVKRLVRDIEGLPSDEAKKPKKRAYYNTKVQPTDYQQFKHELQSKYPTWEPPEVETPIPELSLDHVAAAAIPRPLRPLFPHGQDHAQDQSELHQQQQQQQAPPQPATPAPTPPQSPQMKPKKLQFQTDQNRPFVLPYSARNTDQHGQPIRIPRAIAEASDLYSQHVRISTELWQTVKLREEMISDESGTSQAEADLVQQTSAGLGGLEGRMAGLRLAERGSAVEDDDQDMADPLDMLQQLEQEMKRKVKGKGPAEEEKVEDVRRLQRIEIFYRLTLSDQQSAVIVLLKLLLATVAPNSTINGMAASENDPPPQLTLEETDILRHREITSKSVSAVLLLLLRWFKVSHAMKFQYLSQLLVDSNCLLLILKIFGLHEVSAQVKHEHEHPPANFFRWCAEHGSRSGASRDQEVSRSSRPAMSPSPLPGPPYLDAESEYDLVDDFAPRNFFSVINFVHILHKLTKRKLHRVLLLVQYKSHAILKRLLKVQHPLVQLYTLKVIKSQIPYCGRKWRQSNMKVITSIYLYCRPDLRDEWLIGADIDGDVEDSLPNEQALRALVKFFNQKHYLPYASLEHRRSSSQYSGDQQAAQGEGAAAAQSEPQAGHVAVEESFPPSRSMAMFGRAPAFRPSYIPDSLADSFMGDEYEAILGDLLTPRYTVDSNGTPSLFPDGSGAQAESVWSRLGELLGDTGDVSDTESVGSMEALRFADVEPADEPSEPVPGETRAGWSEMSPEIIMALEEERDNGVHLSPRSPRPRRGSTEPKSPALRPVLASVENESEELVGPAQAAVEDEERGPIPSEAHSGPAVDEVEAVFGE